MVLRQQACLAQKSSVLRGNGSLEMSSLPCFLDSEVGPEQGGSLPWKHKKCIFPKLCSPASQLMAYLMLDARAGRDRAASAQLGALKSTPNCAPGKESMWQIPCEAPSQSTQAGHWFV